MVLSENSLCTNIDIFIISSKSQHLPPTIDTTAPIIPVIRPLSTQIFASFDKLFFVYYRIPVSKVTVCALVRCWLNESLNDNPTSLQYVIFLV